MKRSPLREHVAQPESGLRSRRPTDALLDQLVMVFQGIAREQSAAEGHAFASQLPRYEFKTKSIFPEVGKVVPQQPSDAVRAHAQLRTLLNRAGVGLDTAHDAPAARALMGALERYARRRDGGQRPTALPALPANTSREEQSDAALAKLRGMLESMLRERQR